MRHLAVTRLLFAWLATCLLSGAISHVAAQTVPPQRVPDRAARSERAYDLAVRGQRLVTRGDPGSAVWFLREALRTDPTQVLAATVLADVYLARGEPSAARDVVLDVLARAPGHAVLWLRLSRTLNALHAPNDAVEALREGLRHVPVDEALLRELAQWSLQRGEWLRALTLQRALSTTRRDGPDSDVEEALQVIVGSSDRARGLRCEPQLSSVRRALCRCALSQ